MPLVNPYVKKIHKVGKYSIPIYSDLAFSELEKAGKLAKETLLYIEPFVKAGVSTLELDKLCHDFIVKNNAIPAPLNYNGFPKSICTSINHVVCHGIPSTKDVLKDGDIINIDVTVILNGFYGDTSKTFKIGKTSIKANNLVKVTKECLDKSISILKPGVTTGDIGAVIQAHAHKNFFSVVENFIGHGIGQEFHQDPEIFHYGKKGEGVALEEGMVFTIEPMINAGKKQTSILQDGWTAVTSDRSLSAQFEHTVGITANGFKIFTK